jgi:hypothetical protein
MLVYSCIRAGTVYPQYWKYETYDASVFLY